LITQNSKTESRKLLELPEDEFLFGVVGRIDPKKGQLLALKAIVESHTAETYNSCLLNLYHDGTEGMGWHSDDEKDLKKDGAIASFSLGADRKFAFKHKSDKQTLNVILEHGSILLMKGEVQSHWLHSLPKSTRVLKPRINLTFRTIV
jgi:alkylated DNA repair dioxygenase AlkB